MAETGGNDGDKEEEISCTALTGKATEADSRPVDQHGRKYRRFDVRDKCFISSIPNKMSNRSSLIGTRSCLVCLPAENKGMKIGLSSRAQSK